MQQCSKCGHPFDAESCPICGNHARVSADVMWRNDKSFNRSGILVCAGWFGVMLAHGLYKPLDDRTLEPAAISLVFISGGIGFWFYLACKPTPWNLQFVSRLFACVGLVLVLYSAFVILNGILDHYPLVQAETRVVRTYRSGRRGDDFYIVVIPSWRRGRNQENFEVIGDFDRDLQTGDLIRIEVHRGAFWLPWGPAVTDRMRCPPGVYGPSLC